MGYDINRFCGAVDEELICPICVSVLEDPLQVPSCEHAFCKRCIHEWLNRQPTCPMDHQTIFAHQLRPVPRILKNLLSRLTITCENQSHGCTGVFKLDVLPSHLNECEHNPNKLVPSEMGCGFVVPKDEVEMSTISEDSFRMHSEDNAEYRSLLLKNESLIFDRDMKEARIASLRATMRDARFHAAITKFIWHLLAKIQEIEDVFSSNMFVDDSDYETKIINLFDDRAEELRLGIHYRKWIALLYWTSDSTSPQLAKLRQRLNPCHFPLEEKRLIYHQFALSIQRIFDVFDDAIDYGHHHFEVVEDIFYEENDIAKYLEIFGEHIRTDLWDLHLSLL